VNSPLPEVTVFSRRGCHLCELLIEELIPVCRGRARILVKDVDEQPDWQAAYGTRIPVVSVGGREVSAVRLDEARLLAALDDERTARPSGA
jgi:hypothetical protein